PTGSREESAMAAIAYDNHDRQGTRPALRLVHGGLARRRAMYRRRRSAALLVMVAAAAVMMLAIVPAVRAGMGALGGSPLTPAGAPAAPALQPVASNVVVVQSGDTLWSIARRLQPTGDVRPLVDRLAAAHGHGPLQPGERLPVR